MGKKKRKKKGYGNKVWDRFLTPEKPSGYETTYVAEQAALVTTPKP